MSFPGLFSGRYVRICSFVPQDQTMTITRMIQQLNQTHDQQTANHHGSTLHISLVLSYKETFFRPISPASLLKSVFWVLNCQIATGIICRKTEEKPITLQHQRCTWHRIYVDSTQTTGPMDAVVAPTIIETMTIMFKRPVPHSVFSNISESNWWPHNLHDLQI